MGVHTAILNLTLEVYCWHGSLESRDHCRCRPLAAPGERYQATTLQVDCKLRCSDAKANLGPFNSPEQMVSVGKWCQWANGVSGQMVSVGKWCQWANGVRGQLVTGGRWCHGASGC